MLGLIRAAGVILAMARDSHSLTCCCEDDPVDKIKEHAPTHRQQRTAVPTFQAESDARRAERHGRLLVPEHKMTLFEGLAISLTLGPFHCVSVQMSSVLWRDGDSRWQVFFPSDLIWTLEIDSLLGKYSLLLGKVKSGQSCPGFQEKKSQSEKCESFRAWELENPTQLDSLVMAPQDSTGRRPWCWWWQPRHGRTQTRPRHASSSY